MTLFELDIRDAMIAERDRALRVAFGGAALAVYAETAAAVPEDAAPVPIGAGGGHGAGGGRGDVWDEELRVLARSVGALGEELRVLGRSEQDALDEELRALARSVQDALGEELRVLGRAVDALGVRAVGCADGAEQDALGEELRVLGRAVAALSARDLDCDAEAVQDALTAMQAFSARVARVAQRVWAIRRRAVGDETGQAQNGRAS